MQATTAINQNASKNIAQLQNYQQPENTAEPAANSHDNNEPDTPVTHFNYLLLLSETTRGCVAIQDNRFPERLYVPLIIESTGDLTAKIQLPIQEMSSTGCKVVRLVHINDRDFYPLDY